MNIAIAKLTPQVKKYFSYLLLVASPFLTTAVILAGVRYISHADFQNAKLVFAPEVLTAAVGDNVESKIYLFPENNEVTGVDIDLSFDPNSLEVVSASKAEGSGFENFQYTVEDNQSSGSAILKISTTTYSGGEPSNPVGGTDPVEVASIVFKALSQGPATVEFIYNGYGDTTDCNVIVVEGEQIIDVLEEPTTSLSFSHSNCSDTLQCLSRVGIGSSDCVTDADCQLPPDGYLCNSSDWSCSSVPSCHVGSDSGCYPSLEECTASCVSDVQTITINGVMQGQAEGNLDGLAVFGVYSVVNDLPGDFLGSGVVSLDTSGSAEVDLEELGVSLVSGQDYFFTLKGYRQLKRLKLATFVPNTTVSFGTLLGGDVFLPDENGSQDGEVNSADLSKLIAVLWRTDKDYYDLNADGEINSVDLSMIIANWFGQDEDSGSTPPPPPPPSAFEPGWESVGSLAGGQLGRGTAVLEDANGDGYSDVAFGVPYYNDGSYPINGEGMVRVCYGSAGGVSSNCWSWESDVWRGAAGGSVASAGDTNSDGYTDLLVGSLGANDVPNRVWVFYGSASGYSASNKWEYIPEASGTLFGYYLGISGDYNNDGYSDISVYETGYPAGQSATRLMVFYGTANGPSKTNTWQIAGENGISTYTASFGSVGDVSGDGIDDFFAIKQNTNQYLTQAVYYKGSASGLGTSPNLVIGGTFQAFSSFGMGGFGSGDFNGDGFQDIAVGAPTHDASQTDEGAIHVIYNSSSGFGGGHAPDLIASGWDGAYFGEDMAAVGDFDNDGFDDVLAGAHRYSGGSSRGGRVILLKGDTNGLNNPFNADLIFDGSCTDCYMGLSVCGGGDINNDGYPDAIVGEPQHSATAEYSKEGAVYVFYGGNY